MDEVFVSIISIVGTISAIGFAYLAFRKNENKSLKVDAKSEGALISDIGYIKSAIDRMEKKFDNIEEKYQSILIRLVKVEESLLVTKKQIKKIMEESD